MPHSGRTSVVFTATCVASLALAVPAWAAPARDPAAAEAFFEQGRTAAARQDWEHACDAFEQSESLDPAAGTLLNLGDCRMHLGKVASAWQDFVEALRELPPNDDRRGYAQGRVAEVEKRLPHVVVVLRLDSPSRSTVLKNGVEMPSATLGVAVPVDPGPLTLVVRSPGRLPATFSAVAREGATTRVDVATGPAEAPPAPVLSTSPSLNPWRTAGIVTTAAGGVALVVGGVTGGLALGRAAAYRSTCGASAACPDASSLDAAQSAARDARAFATVSTATLIAGAVAATAGLTILFTHPSREGSSSVSLSPLPGGAAAGWRATF